MSIYNVNYLCREVLRDLAFREAMRTDPRAALGRYELTATERAALEAGDVGKLYKLGANSFVMGYLARYGVLGLDFTRYGERMRAVDGMGGTERS
jgi:hypothetical protein